MTLSAADCTSYILSAYDACLQSGSKHSENCHCATWNCAKNTQLADDQCA